MCILTNLQFRCFVQRERMVDGGNTPARERKSLTTSLSNAATFYQLQNENSFIAAFWSIDVKIVWSFSFQHFPRPFFVASRLLLFLSAWIVGQTCLDEEGKNRDWEEKEKGIESLTSEVDLKDLDANVFLSFLPEKQKIEMKIMENRRLRGKRKK